jgi:hypothetical protein
MCECTAFLTTAVQIGTSTRFEERLRIPRCRRLRRKDEESRTRNAAMVEGLFINHTLPVGRKSFANSIANQGSPLICSTCGALQEGVR